MPSTCQKPFLEKKEGESYEFRTAALKKAITIVFFLVMPGTVAVLTVLVSLDVVSHVVAVGMVMAGYVLTCALGYALFGGRLEMYLLVLIALASMTSGLLQLIEK